MTAKQYLMRAWQIDRRIERKIEERDRLVARLESGVGQLNGMPKGGGHDWTDADVKVMELEARIRQEIARLCDVKRQIGEAIDAVEDARYRTLLEMRYRNYYTFEKIAVEMNYSWRQVMRIHREALDAVKDVIECHIQSVV